MKISVKGCGRISCELITVRAVFEVVAVVHVLANRTQMLSINKPTQVVAGPLKRVGVPITRVVHVGSSGCDLVQWPFKTVVRREEYTLVLGACVDHFHDIDFATGSPDTVG